MGVDEFSREGNPWVMTAVQEEVTFQGLEFTAGVRTGDAELSPHTGMWWANSLRSVYWKRGRARGRGGDGRPEPWGVPSREGEGKAEMEP